MAASAELPNVLYGPLHQDVRLQVRAQLKRMLANCAKFPLSIEGLCPRVPLPHSKPYSFVPGLPRLIDARTHPLRFSGRETAARDASCRWETR